MKILLVHSDYIEYEAKKKAVETADEPGEKERVEDCLVAFCSAEDGDDAEVVEKTVAEIKKVAEQVKTKTVVVYPFVHLTSTPSKPAAALETMKNIESSLRHDYEVHRAPFGWYILQPRQSSSSPARPSTWSWRISCIRGEFQISSRGASLTLPIASVEFTSWQQGTTVPSFFTCGFDQSQ